MEPRRFAFEFDPWYRGLLSVLTITPERSWVRVDERLSARFGLWRLATPVENVAAAGVEGPYSALKAIGPRVSLADRGLTFGSSTRRGVCIRFHEPVRGHGALAWLRHPNLTVTVADPEGLASALGFDAASS